MTFSESRLCTKVFWRTLVLEYKSYERDKDFVGMLSSRILPQIVQHKLFY